MKQPKGSTQKPASKGDPGKPIESDKKTNMPAKTVDTATLLKMRLENHLSYGQISEMTGIPKPTIYDKIKRFEKLIGEPEEITAYTDSRVKILKGVELQLLGDLADEGKREKASLNNVAYAFGQIHQARRLEEGLNTGNETTIEIALGMIRQRQSGAAVVSGASSTIDITPNSGPTPPK